MNAPISYNFHPLCPHHSNSKSTWTIPSSAPTCPTNCRASRPTSSGPEATLGAGPPPTPRGVVGVVAEGEVEAEDVVEVAVEVVVEANEVMEAET